MERTTVKTVLLVIGSAIGGILVFVAAIVGYFTYKFSGHNPELEVSLPSWRREPRETVLVPPEIKERFLGTQGRFFGGFSHERDDKVLATGPGTIAGSVTSGGMPLEGLRLRLGLNGSVMSGWVTTDAAGKYVIGVPYGKYRVDGYQLDYSVVDRLLGGQVDAPQNYDAYGSNAIIEIAQGQPGKGPDFAYVDPVRKKSPKGKVSLSGPVVLEWEAYPGAEGYQVQLVEQKDERDFASQKRLIDWSKLPTVSGTSLNLTERGIRLKKGYSYTVEIHALDARQRSISTSADFRGAADFVTTD